MAKWWRREITSGSGPARAENPRAWSRRSLLAAGTASVAGLAAGCSSSEAGSATGTPSPSDSRTPTSGESGLADKISTPFFIAHRGGAARYPEHSMPAYAADARAGFAIELDVQLLADDTPVVIHDSTVDRTMTGHGKVKHLTREEWEKMRIKPVTSGGKPAKPQFFDDVLDKFGGKHLIVPEIKSHDAQDAVIKTIVKRHLTHDVIVQSFFYHAAVAAAEAGIPAMWLTDRKSTSKQFAKASGAGITYIGYEASLPHRYVTEITEAGLKPVPWVVNSVRDAHKQIDAGAVGLFTDDPWKLARADY